MASCVVTGPGFLVTPGGAAMVVPDIAAMPKDYAKALACPTMACIAGAWKDGNRSDPFLFCAYCAFLRLSGSDFGLPSFGFGSVTGEIFFELLLGFRKRYLEMRSAGCGVRNAELNEASGSDSQS
jgi:hypothetical protein